MWTTPQAKGGESAAATSDRWMYASLHSLPFLPSTTDRNAPSRRGAPPGNQARFVGNNRDSRARP